MGRLYCKRSSINRIMSSQILVGLQNSTISLIWIIWINIVYLLIYSLDWHIWSIGCWEFRTSSMTCYHYGYREQGKYPPPLPRSPVWPVTRSARTSPLKLPPPGSSPPTINQDPGFKRPPLSFFVDHVPKEKPHIGPRASKIINDCKNLIMSITTSPIKLPHPVSPSLQRPWTE